MNNRHQNAEDIEAEARRNLGIERRLQANPTTSLPDPSSGGSAGYPVWYRAATLQQFQTMQPADVSISSLHRGMHDGILSTGQTGNEKRETIIPGNEQMMMAIFLTAYPDANADEIATFLYAYSENIYSRSQINKQLKVFESAKKRVSTAEYQVYSPRNKLIAELFYSHPPPLGRFGVQRERLLDTDEAAFELIITRNCKTGHAHASIRCRKIGHYRKNEKLTVILTIEPGDPNLQPHVLGSTGNPRRWLDINFTRGTTAEQFSDHCERFCHDIATNPQGPADSLRWPMWDELGSHTSPLVYHTVEGRVRPTRFWILRRPLYRPWLSPMEFVFRELTAELQRRVQPTWTYLVLAQEIRNIVAELGMDGKFNNTFAHCGY